MAVGTQHEKGCQRRSDVVNFSCQYCDLVGPSAWVGVAGNHHVSSCSRYSNVAMGICKHCDCVAGQALVTQDGAYHNRKCPRYKGGSWWMPISWCTGCDVAHSNTEDLPMVSKEESELARQCSSQDRTLLDAQQAGKGGTASDEAVAAAEGQAEAAAARPAAPPAAEESAAPGNGVEAAAQVEDNPALDFVEEEAGDKTEGEKTAGLDAAAAANDQQEKPAEAAPAGTVMMQIEIPPGVAPGQLLQVQAPSGQMIQVAVPDGMAPGQQLQFRAPAAPAPSPAP